MVGDKLDWFLEDEDSWLEPWQADLQESRTDRKRPLEAISRRVSSNNSASRTTVQNSEGSWEEGEWPDESSFRVERWRRGTAVDETVDSEKFSRSRPEPMSSERRSLPRSSRRRS